MGYQDERHPVVIEPERRPAYYSARPGGVGDWWTILHPPYTAWHLSYVVIGACLAPHVDGGRLLATLAAFFAAVGIAAHALDELHGRPLHTEISSRALVIAAVLGLAVAVAIGTGVAAASFDQVLSSACLAQPARSSAAILTARLRRV